MVPSDAHPGIFDVAVYGVLHDKWREVGKANIVLKDRAILTAEDVVEFLKGKIVKFRKGESDVMVQKEKNIVLLRNRRGMRHKPSERFGLSQAGPSGKST